MRETKFIEENRKDWEKFEAILKSSNKEPDQLSNQFIRIINDLSYARTFYPNRSVRVYLNNLAQRVFYSIYKNRKEKGNRFVRFWVMELPSVAYRKRKDLFLSFVVFTLAVAIGVLSSVNDPEFARVILGDKYVDMTIENIENNDPMAVYKTMNGVDMFLGITINNLRVAFQTFIMGILMAVGTLAIMLYNGIMVGTFQYFFIERGLFWESFLTIWLHGTLEISAIIIAGASGIVLGKGLVFPGTYPRLQSLQISAGQGLKLFIGVVPILIFAAIIESFMTRFTEAPDILKGALIVMSLIFIVFYFFWYPYSLNRRGALMPELKPELSQKTPFVINAQNRIKSIGEVFKDMFGYYRKHIKKILGIAVVSGIVFSSIAIYLSRLSVQTETIIYSAADQLPYFDFSLQPLMFLNNVLFVTLILHFSIQMLLASIEGYTISMSSLLRSLWSKKLTSALAASIIINATFWLPAVVSVLVLLATAPIIILATFAGYYEKANLINALMRCKELFSVGTWKVYLLFGSLLFLTGLFVLLLESELVDFYQDIFEWNLSIEGTTKDQLLQAMDSFKFIFGLSITLPILIAGVSLMYFSLREILEANSLNSRIEKFGVSAKAYNA